MVDGYILPNEFRPDKIPANTTATARTENPAPITPAIATVSGLMLVRSLLGADTWSTKSFATKPIAAVAKSLLSGAAVVGVTSATDDISLTYDTMVEVFAVVIWEVSFMAINKYCVLKVCLAVFRLVSENRVGVFSDVAVLNTDIPAAVLTDVILA